MIFKLKIQCIYKYVCVCVYIYIYNSSDPTNCTSHILPAHTYLPMKVEQTECSETAAYKIQTPGNYPEESIQHSNLVYLHTCL